MAIPFALLGAAAPLIQGLLGGLTGREVAPQAPQFTPGQGPQGLAPPPAPPIQTSAGGGITDLLQSFNSIAPEEDDEERKPSSNFFDKFDVNVQRPSVQLGLGLLGKASPILQMLGLLSAGIFGGTKK